MLSKKSILLLIPVLIIITGCSSHAVRRSDIIKRNSQTTGFHEDPSLANNPYGSNGILSKESFGNYNEIIVIEKLANEELKESPIVLIIGEKNGVSSLFCIFQYSGEKEIQYDKVLLVNDNKVMLSFDLVVFEGEVNRIGGRLHEIHKIALDGLLEKEVIDFVNLSNEINIRFYGKRITKDFYVEPSIVDGLKEIVSSYLDGNEKEIILPSPQF